MRFPRRRAVLPVLLLPLVLAVLTVRDSNTQAAPPDPRGYLFCFWNCEDLFDDKPNSYQTSPDRECDNWFVRNEQARKQKYENLSQILAALNGGKGPDILALAEVESQRSVELLAEAINARIKNPALHLKTVLFKDAHGGRSISTAVLTRLPALENRTQLLGRRLRILQTVLKVDGQELMILATHWTSRVSDDRGEGRGRYADLVYGAFKAMTLTNPKVDVLICGDFNDNPDDPSVRVNLHAVSEASKVKPIANDPLLFNVFGKRWEEIQTLGKRDGGTHFYRGKPYIFDQIVVSAGMLDKEGWTCLSDTAEIITTGEKLLDRRKAPMRFGGERDRIALEDRGCSDHLPVAVRLLVNPGR